MLPEVVGSRLDVIIMHALCSRSPHAAAGRSFFALISFEIKEKGVWHEFYGVFIMKILKVIKWVLGRPKDPGKKSICASTEVDITTISNNRPLNAMRNTITRDVFILWRFYLKSHNSNINSTLYFNIMSNNYLLLLY